MVRAPLESGQGNFIRVGERSFSRCPQKYRERAQNGIRPLWIGLGGAWTGIDLSDNSVPPEEDRLLTDLIITRIPWRLNRSITHLRRMNALKDAERMETLRLFRQGIGRLVRREGVRDRKLHVLDPRIEEKYYASFRKTLQAFDRIASASPWL
jgi:ATP-dependent DNA helicase DinG